MYYLYVKTHNITGLKYLGKTEQNDYHNYTGSGKYWKRHLKKHGKDISTNVLLVTENAQELKETGIFFSKLWDIVKSHEWANCKPEEGDGGWGHINWKGKKRSAEFGEKISKIRKGKGLGPDNNFYGKTHTPESLAKITEVSRKNSKRVYENRMKVGNHPNSFVDCPYCGKHGQSRAMKRWHFDNCKAKPSTYHEGAHSNHLSDCDV